MSTSVHDRNNIEGESTEINFKSHGMKNDLGILLMATAGMFLDGYQLSVISLAVLYMAPDLKLSQFQISLVLGSVILGTIIGTISIGYISDLFGRRKIYIYNLAFFLFFGIISILTSNLTLIIISRLLMGVSVGADYPVSNSYIAEMAPKEIRGKYLSFSNVAFVAGAVISMIVSIIVFGIKSINPDLGWRIMIGAGLIPAVFVLYLRMKMPESKMWEEKREKNGIIHIAKSMFKGKAGRFTILTAVIWFFYDMVIFGVSLFNPTLMNMIYGGNVTDLENAMFASLFLLVLLIASVILMMNVDRLGRKRTQFIGFLGIGIILFLLPSWYYNLVWLIILLIIVEIFNGFPSTTIGMFPAELAKTEFRASSYGFASMLGKIGALTGVLILGTELNPKNLWIFYLFGVFTLIIALLTLMLRETTNVELDSFY